MALKKKICVNRVKLKGKWFSPGDEIKVDEQELSRLGGAVRDPIKAETGKKAASEDDDLGLGD